MPVRAQCVAEHRSRALLALLTAAALAIGTLARADPARSDDEPGVARVSLIEGQGSYLRPDAEEWSPAAANLPLVTGDRYYAGPDSRSEVQLAPGIDARLGPATELDMSELAPGATQVRLVSGRATIRLRRDPERRHVEIDTPAAALVLERRGVYRVEVEASGDATVMVREGELVVHATDGDQRLRDGEGATIRLGDRGGPSRFALGPPDDWDAWESERAQRIARAASYQYVSEDIYGGEDLDDHGVWAYRRGYGQLWRPTYVAAGWAPYTSGRWTWVGPWGWTWLDSAAWGWAPFHYGRWVYLDDLWFWAPGPVVAAPAYAPALVGFYGAGLGAGFSLSIGIGPAIGWVPLGWGEPCIPWWGGWRGVRVGVPWWGGWGGPLVVNNVFIRHADIERIDVGRIRLQNVSSPHALTTVTRRSFLTGEHERVAIGRGDHRELSPIIGRVPIGPEPESRRALGPGRGSRPDEGTNPDRRTALGGRMDPASRVSRDGRTGPDGRTSLGGQRDPVGVTGKTPASRAIAPPAVEAAARRTPVVRQPGGATGVPYVAPRPAIGDGRRGGTDATSRAPDATPRTAAPRSLGLHSTGTEPGMTRSRPSSALSERSSTSLPARIEPRGSSSPRGRSSGVAPSRPSAPVGGSRASLGGVGASHAVPSAARHAVPSVASATAPAAARPTIAGRGSYTAPRPSGVATGASPARISIQADAVSGTRMAPPHSSTSRSAGVASRAGVGSPARVGGAGGVGSRGVFGR